jgi:hypothetical protein
VTSAKSGDTVVEDSTRTELTEQHPNGTSCPPTAWTATFRAHPEKGLTSPEGMKLQRRTLGAKRLFRPAPAPWLRCPGRDQRAL